MSPPRHGRKSPSAQQKGRLVRAVAEYKSLAQREKRLDRALTKYKIHSAVEKTQEVAEDRAIQRRLDTLRRSRSFTPDASPGTRDFEIQELMHGIKTPAMVTRARVRQQGMMETPAAPVVAVPSRLPSIEADAAGILETPRPAQLDRSSMGPGSLGSPGFSSPEVARGGSESSVSSRPMSPVDPPQESESEEEGSVVEVPQVAPVPAPVALPPGMSVDGAGRLIVSADDVDSTPQVVFSCGVGGCSKQYQNRASLLRHMKALHGENGPKCCRFCTKQYVYDRCLQEHERTCPAKRRGTKRNGSGPSSGSGPAKRRA